MCITSPKPSKTHQNGRHSFFSLGHTNTPAHSKYLFKTYIIKYRATQEAASTRDGNTDSPATLFPIKKKPIQMAYCHQYGFLYHLLHFLYYSSNISWAISISKPVLFLTNFFSSYISIGFRVIQPSWIRYGTLPASTKNLLMLSITCFSSLK